MRPLSPLEAAQLIRRMLDEHGELLGGVALGRCLGFRSPRAFQMAVSRASLPVEVFKLAGRRGQFARTIQVAQWLAGRAETTEPTYTEATQAARESRTWDVGHD